MVQYFGAFHAPYCLEGLKRYEEAIACYDKALKIDPNLDIASDRKAQCLERLGRR